MFFFIFFSHDHIELLVRSDGELLFYKQREGPWMPTLKLLHRCKFITLFNVSFKSFKLGFI